MRKAIIWAMLSVFLLIGSGGVAFSDEMFPDAISGFSLAGVDSAVSSSGTQLAASSSFAITSPAPNSKISSATVTFQWASGAAEYWLWVGSSVNGYDYYNSGSLGTSTSATATGLPTDGSTIIYARLWYKLVAGGTWAYTDCTYNSYLISSPVPGSGLNPISQTFQWNSGAAEYWLWVGSSVGGYDYYNSGSLGTATSATVTGLPSDGSTVYVRFWYRSVSGGSWASTDYTYTGGYVIISPVSGSTLNSTTVKFQWTSGAAEYWLWVGSSAGSNNYYDSGSPVTTTSVTVTGLPSDGSTVYVRFWYKAISGEAWAYKDFKYTATGISITAPKPGTMLGSTEVTFQWTSGAAEYWLQIGSIVGGNNYYDSGSPVTTTSVTVTGLPGDSSTVYVRLWYRATSSEAWTTYKDYIYTASGYGIISPMSGISLSSATQTFQWNSGAAEYYLQIGSNVGGNNYYDSGSLGTSTSVTVTGLPTDGSVVCARLWYKLTSGSAWALHDDSIYNGYAITSPVQDSALAATTVTFQWNSGAAEYYLQMGSSPGGYNYYDSGSPVTATSATVTTLPNNGNAVYARLWYRISTNSDWTYTDCAYKAVATYVVTFPTSGSALSSSTVIFQWNSGAAEYWLQIGSSPGNNSYYDSGSLGTSTSATVTNLPTSGMVYARFWYRTGTTWTYGDYIYGGFNEQFKGVAYNWNSDYGNWIVRQYYYTMGISGYNSTSTYNQTYTDVDYSARLLRTGENSSTNRLVIRASGAIGTDGHFANEYSFQYSRNGSFSVYKRVQGVAGVLQNWTSSSAINKYSQWNTLQVIAVGSNLSFYINGQLVWSGADRSLTSGKVGVGMYRDTTADNGFYVNWATLSIPSAATSQSLTAATTGYEALTADNPASSGAVNPSDGDIDRSGL